MLAASVKSSLSEGGFMNETWAAPILRSMLV